MLEKCPLLKFYSSLWPGISKPVWNADRNSAFVDLTFNWLPPVVPSGELEKFVMAYRVGTSRVDGGKCEEQKFRDLIGKEKHPSQNIIIDDAKMKTILDSLVEKCARRENKYEEYTKTRRFKRTTSCSG